MTDLPQAAIEAINAPDSPWPARNDWTAAARTDGAGPDARRKVLLHGAQLAAPHIAAAERERIRQDLLRGDPCPLERAFRAFIDDEEAADCALAVADLITEGDTT